MSEKVNHIGKNKFGDLYYCLECSKFHLIFNNFHFSLSKSQLISLRNYVYKLETSFYEDEHRGIDLKRKIPVPTFQENLVLIFNNSEFLALKELLFNNQNPQRILTLDEMDYNSILN